MKVLLKCLAIVGVLAGFAVAACSAYVTWQVSQLDGIATAEPQAMTAGELIEKGAGDNLHVQLTGFTFGKPVIEVGDGYFKNVWIPILPAKPSSKPSKTTLFLGLGMVRNQVQIDPVLARTTLDLLVANPLPDSSMWKKKGNEFFWHEQPKIDPAAVVFLVEPEFRSFGNTLLTGQQVCDRGSATLAWGFTIAGLLGAVAGLGLMFWVGGWRKVQTAPAGGTEVERQRLIHEVPLSAHYFDFWMCLYLSIHLMIVAAVLFVIGLATLGGTANCIQTGQPDVAAFCGGITLLLFAGVLWILNSVIGSFTDRVSEIVVCPNGLRWHQYGKFHLAVWADLASVERQEVITTNRGVVVDQTGYITIQFHSGQKLDLTSKVLTDFPRFADQVVQNYNSVNAYCNRPGQVNLESAFGFPSRGPRR